MSDETGTLFNCALDYLKRVKRLNPLTHWDIHVTGGEVAPSSPDFRGLWLPRESHSTSKLRVTPISTACGCLVQATALLRSNYVIVRLLALLRSSYVIVQLLALLRLSYVIDLLLVFVC